MYICKNLSLRWHEAQIGLPLQDDLGTTKQGSEGAVHPESLPFFWVSKTGALTLNLHGSMPCPNTVMAITTSGHSSGHCQLEKCSCDRQYSSSGELQALLCARTHGAGSHREALIKT